MGRIVKRVYRITADPVKETEAFKNELERVLNQLMEEEEASGYLAEEQNLLVPSVSDVTDSRSINQAYKNTHSTMIRVDVSIKHS